jgi:glutaconate CoA-transferase subunit B
MTVAASRAIPDGAVCFVGIGAPSAAANLARRTHAPDAVLVYESGVIGARPDVLPLSIGDGELTDGALAVVSVPELFAYWLQGGRIDVGFLGTAQIDRFANLNTTVVGPYARPAARLPGAGGAPEIAAAARETVVVVRHHVRAFVERLDFVTTVGHAHGGRSRAALGLPGGGPSRVITDLGVLEPDPDTRELTLTAVHAGATRGRRAARHRLAAARGRRRARAAAADRHRAGSAARAARAHAGRPRGVGRGRMSAADAGAAVRADGPPDPPLAALCAALRERGFSAPAVPARVVFGAGALARLPELVDALGGRRVVVVAGAGRRALVERIAGLLGPRLVAVDARAVMHVPAALADAVAADVARAGADLLVAVGGGSAVGMAKAVALAGGPPVMAVPTTYAGSEMTPIWGRTRGGAKETGRDERVRPRAVLYDPTLTLDLPPRVAGPSALNAAAHAVEALYAPDASPLVALAAARGSARSPRRAARGPRAGRPRGAHRGALRRVAGRPRAGRVDHGAAPQALPRAGGAFGLPHAETHAVVLPHAAAYNAPAAAAAMAAGGGARWAAATRPARSTRSRPTSPRRRRAGVAAGARAARGGPRSGRGGGRRPPVPQPAPRAADAVRALLGRAWAGGPPDGA